MRTNEAFITPSVLEWAIKRAGVSAESIHKKAEQWVSGKARPTFKQAVDLAKALQIPFGYLWLKEPPKEQEIIPDLRTIGNTANPERSLTLKTLLRDAKFKQEWFKDYLTENNIVVERAVGQFTINDDIDEIATDIAEKLKASDVVAKGKRKDDVLRYFIKKAEKLNILVMKNKTLGATKNRLSLSEFRGFAIYDAAAPLVFINSNDSAAAQIFTLMHELAHLWIGQSGISNLETEGASEVELKCNEIAARILMPEVKIRQFFSNGNAANLLNEASSAFSVSPLSILNRIRNLGLIAHDAYRELYAREQREFSRTQTHNDAEDSRGFAPPQKLARSRNGDLFSFAVVEAVLNGKESYTNGARLLDYRKINIVEKVGKEFGMLK